MFRHLVAQNSLALRALGIGVGPVQQLSLRGIFKYNSKAFLHEANIPQHTFSYPRLASTLPASASRRPISLTSDNLYTRTYVSSRRVPPPPSTRNEPIIILPDAPEPIQQPPDADPEDFAPKREIRYIELGFLAVFMVLYIVYGSTTASLRLKYQKEVEEQTKEIILQGGKLPTNITIRLGELQSSSIEARLVRIAKSDSKDGVPAPGPDSFTQELELSLSEPGKLFMFLHKNFIFSPVKLFPVDGFNDIGLDFRPWTAVTASLLHGNIFHLLACYFTLKVFTGPLIFLYGAQKFLGLFFAGAGLAATIYAGTERIVNPAVSMTPEQRQKASETGNEERKAVLRYFGSSIGSSGALVALGM